MPDWLREEQWVAQPTVLCYLAMSLFVSQGGSPSMQAGAHSSRCTAGFTVLRWVVSLDGETMVWC